MERERLGSRLGFILLSAGCAIGIGNVWKFPTMTGQNGGGAFVLIYILFLVILGVPIMTMEFAVGRASQKSPVKAYNVLEKPGQKWHIHGVLAMIGNYLLMMFYTTVGGWMLHYFYLTASGRFEAVKPAGESAAELETATQAVAGIFDEMLGQPLVMAGWMILVVVLGFLINSVGLQNGIERITKVMMIALLAIMVVLAVQSIMLENGSKGLEFYLVPSLENMQKVGIGNVIVSAMNQAFFTLSLGIGAMAIFGSYINKERTLMGEAINVAILDTFVAFVSGLIIFPACYSFNVQPDAGPPLIFITLPNIFNRIPGGRLWGSLFFVFMAFAAFSTILAVFENIMSCCRDLFGWSRKKAALINAVLMVILSMPCVLGYNVLADFHPFGDPGKQILDLEDFLVSNIWLPLGSLVYLLFCVSRAGWGWKNFIKEANAGKGVKMPGWLRPYLTYVLPLIVLFIFAYGIYSVFA